MSLARCALLWEKFCLLSDDERLFCVYMQLFYCYDVMLYVRGRRTLAFYDVALEEVCSRHACICDGGMCMQ